jgi:hypothetical protein
VEETLVADLDDSEAEEDMDIDAWLLAEDAIEDAMLLADDAMDDAMLLADDAIEDGLLLADDAMDDADATAELGTETDTPAALQVFVTPEITAAWSEDEQAFWTQGVTAEIRVSNFWQWHLKSVNWEQPSEPNGVRKHESCLRISWCTLRFQQKQTYCA